MGNMGEQLVTIATAIVGLAIIAVLVSRNAQTPAVIGAASGGFAHALAVAISPVSGNTLLGPSGGFAGSGFGGYGGF